MIPQSVCWFSRFIHLFVYFFAYLKLLDSQSWSIHLKWNLLICIFFKKHRKWTVSWALQSCKWSSMQTSKFFIWALPRLRRLHSGSKPLCLWKVSCCWLRPRPLERFIPFWYKPYIRSDSIVSMFFLHLFYDVSESCPALIIWAFHHWPHVTSATMPRAQVAVLVEICQRPWDKRWAKSGVHASHAMSESPFAATTTTTTPPPLQLQLSRKLAPRPWPPRLRLALLMVVGPQKQKWDVSTYASVLQPGHGFNKAFATGEGTFRGGWQRPAIKICGICGRTLVKYGWYCSKYLMVHAHMSPCMHFIVYISYTIKCFAGVLPTTGERRHKKKTSIYHTSRKEIDGDILSVFESLWIPLNVCENLKKFHVLSVWSH